MGARPGHNGGVDDEVRFHLDARTDELEASGLSRAEARTQALREFGDVDDARAYMRRLDARTRADRWRRRHLDEVRQDVRVALRRLRAAPAFTLAAVLTLALGVGANTAVFSVVNAALLRPLPFPAAEQLYAVYSANPAAGQLRSGVSAVDLDDWRAQRENITDLGGFWFADGQSGLDLTGRGNPRRLSGVFVAPGFFSTLGVEPAAGRLPREDEMVRGGPDRVVVLSHGFWQREFGGGADVPGSTVTLGGEPFEILGVLPERFRFPSDGVDVYVPFSTIPDSGIPRLRQVRILDAFARAGDGVDQAGVEAELSVITGRLAQEYPENRNWNQATVVPLHDVVVGPTQQAGLVVLFGAVGLVLLMACVNVASLQLARADRRGREIALRQALGAGRGRLIRQLLTESLVLAAMGGTLGLALGTLGIDAFLSLSADQLPRAAEVKLDGTVVAFALGLTVVVGLLFGLIPALRTSSTDVQTALRAGGRGTAGSGHRLRTGLIVSEVAVAMILVVGAGLTARSFQTLTRVDPGFDAEGLLAVQFTIDSDRHSGTGTPPTPGFASPWTAYYYRAIEAVRALPGVTAAGAVKDAPFHGVGERNGFTVAGRPVPAGEDSPSATFMHISDGFFAAMGTRIIDGREFTPRDRAGSPWVVVVNDTFARQVFPGERAVGARVLLGGELDAEIVGVVNDIRQVAMATPARPTIYINNLQNSRIKTTIIARTTGDPAALANPIRDAIWSLDPNQTITAVFTLDDAVRTALARPRFLAVLLGSFGILGLALGAVGLYGVLASLVGERRREIGVRLALGASPAGVGRMIVRRGLTLCAVGIVIGLVGALGLGRFVEAVLYGVGPTDPATLSGVALVLAAAAALASWLPARRAARLDPVETLRTE